MTFENDLLLMAGVGIGAYLLFPEEVEEFLEGIFEGDLPLIEFDPTYDEDRIKKLIKDESDIYRPIQHLYVPKGWPMYKPWFDPYRTPSKDYVDWYMKGAGLVEKDNYYPEHYLWNPDYYFYFGNLYKKWYPSAMEPDRWAGDRGWEPIAHGQDFQLPLSAPII
jgi:hypothetical protein